MLNIEILDKKWNNLFVDTIILTNCTKLRFFQYRLVNGYVITNSRVSKWDKSITEKCTFCDKEIETVLHLLVECEYVVVIWKSLAKWLDYFAMVACEFTPYEILFNDYKDSFPQMVNTIILIVKYYIYVQRCYGNTPNIRGAIEQIAKYKRIEELVAQRTGKSKKNTEKWAMYDTV